MAGHSAQGVVKVGRKPKQLVRRRLFVSLLQRMRVRLSGTLLSWLRT